VGAIKKNLLGSGEIDLLLDTSYAFETKPIVHFFASLALAEKSVGR
jgi:hypothetical protein